MRVVNGGQVEITEADLAMLREMGCEISMHTPSYANHIVARLPDGNTLGFHNWLSNANCYVGDAEVRLSDDAHLAGMLDLMRAAAKFKTCLREKG